MAQPYSSTRRAECAARAETKNRRFTHILGAKQFGKYISDGKASAYRIKAPLLNLRSMRMRSDRRSREGEGCMVTVA
jgi:hypothetical protein